MIAGLRKLYNFPWSWPFTKFHCDAIKGRGEAVIIEYCDAKGRGEAVIIEYCDAKVTVFKIFIY